MRVCDVVLNSIWYDPRVRKQIVEYKAKGIDVVCVGMQCARYDVEKIANIPCPVTIVSISEKYQGKQRNPLKKVMREQIRNRDVCNAIVAYKPDVIHANDLNALIPAYMASKKLGCKLIYDSHEVFVENFFNGGHKLYALMLKRKEKNICKKVDKMICVSHAAAEYFAKEYKIPMPMVITNCSLKAEQVVSNEKNPGFEVLNHGQFYAGRGYDIMVEASQYLKDYPDIRLAMRGFGVMEQKLRDRVEELKTENVIFYPRVLVEELIPYASRSMVGVAMTEAICLNFKLSVSNKLFEYASAGLPVIMSDIPEHRYLNEKFNFGIVLEDNSPETFANAVIRLYEDKQLYVQLAENARKMSDDMNWENEFGRLIAFEKTIIKTVN